MSELDDRPEAPPTDDAAEPSNRFRLGDGIAVEYGEPSRGHATANFGCPRCDRELNPGPWNSWICWACGDVIYVEGSESR